MSPYESVFPEGMDEGRALALADALTLFVDRLRYDGAQEFIDKGTFEGLTFGEIRSAVDYARKYGWD
jgi:hypothetical protein